MSEDEKVTSVVENASNNNASLDKPPPQAIQYLQNLDKRLEEERKREIHERFRNIRCFQHILGPSTSFKLTYNQIIFSNAKMIIEPQNLDSAPIRVWHNSVPNTWAMSLRSETEPEFLTYVSHLNEITVFCPELPEPIGRIVRRENDDGADIFCLATSKTFTLANVETDSPASMGITDSCGTVVGIGNVSEWRKIGRYSTTTHLRKFTFQVQNGLSEPTRVMLLICFATWATWTNDNVRSQNRTKRLIGLGIGIVFLLVVFLSLKFYY